MHEQEVRTVMWQDTGVAPGCQMRMMERMMEEIVVILEESFLAGRCVQWTHS